jgi:hypothetical protein
MSRPEFFEPEPVSENIRIKFEDLEPIRRKPVLRRRPGYYFPIVSVLGKRKLEVAFGRGMNDKERYGQEIPPDFFKINQGHNAFSSSISDSSNISFKNLYEDRIKFWREKYMSKR